MNDASTIDPQVEDVAGIPAPRQSLAGALPELLSPAGDWDCAKAAVENGADAIYFGLERFNARMRARNFTETDLPRLMEFLHRRGIKGYVTFNTLVFADELPEAGRYLRTIIAAGVDAAIVQDIGICLLIRRLSPDFPIHCSTQMTITSAAGVAFARELGCQLVVLGRECCLKEIEALTAAVGQDGSSGGGLGSPAAVLPLEVFVHGALCVAYSGQCLTSEALGGRSANRGECAQACRMPYELICDGKRVPLGDKKYLLSPQDLAGLPVIPDLIRLGVAALKIEGRLKSPEYVANITRIYRQAIDAAAGLAAKPRSDQSARPGVSAYKDLSVETRYDLEMAFSRGLYTGWFNGINNQQLVHARFGKKRGVFLGTIFRIQGDRVFARLEAPLNPGDGIVFDNGHPEEAEEGGRVYEAAKRGEVTEIGFGRGDVDFERLRTGDRIWKTSDPKLERRLRKTFTALDPQFRRPIHWEAHGCEGCPLTLICRDDLGNVAQVCSAAPLERAENSPLTTARLKEQLRRLGGTGFRLGDLRNCLDGAVLLPWSQLNQMRREAIARLEECRAHPRRWQLRPVPEVKARARTSDTANPIQVAAENSKARGRGQPVRLVALVRDGYQLQAAWESGIRIVYCDFEDPKKYRDAVNRFRQWSSSDVDPDHGTAILVAPPRIFKTGEEWILRQVRVCEADGYLVRNYDHLRYFEDSRRVGDFSLNVANPLTAEYFKHHCGLDFLTASYDLNILQLEALLQSAPPEWFEITIHQHMPMFHMEHCVYCAFLSTGTNYTNCGRPCDKHEVKLRDRIGAEHPLKADLGCRNTVFNAKAQTGAETVSRLLAVGAARFRIEFVNETPREVRQILSRYQALFRGEISGAQLWRELRLNPQLGVTRGPVG